MTSRPTFSRRVRWIGLALAFALWYLTFVVRPAGFWPMMAGNILLLAGLAWLGGRPLWRMAEWTRDNVALGVAGAGILYGVFWIGNQALILLARGIPWLAHRPENLAAIYAGRSELAPQWIALLLLLLIGPGEEVFWRGFFQRDWARDIGPFRGLLLSTLCYVLVHVPTGNPVLILAAAVCGVFWGGMFYWRRSLVPGLVSHALWDPLIFVLFPIH